MRETRFTGLVDVFRQLASAKTPHRWLRLDHIEKGAGAALAGEWKYSIEIPGQTQSGVIKITADVDELTIEVSSADSPEDFEEATAVSLNGSNLTFDLSIDYDGFQMELSYDLEIAENAMKGMVKAGQFGSFPLEGSRDPR